MTMKYMIFHTFLPGDNMMTKIKIYVQLFLFVTVFSSGLSAGELSGRVLDVETKGLLSDVNVHLLELNKKVPTDKKGQFVFKNIPDGTYHIVATHIAYDKSDTLLVTVNGIQTLDISLRSSPWVLNDVVVTGTRTPHLLKDVPVQTEVVTSRDFKRTGAKTVDEALTSSIGVTINEDLSGQGASLRGIEGDRVLILVDGERAVGRVRGSIDLSQYALNNVEKIEIVKGNGSTLYGSDAMGGVINIITKRPKATKLGGDVYFDYGKYKQVNPSADLKYGNDNTALLIGGKYYSTAGFDLIDSTLHTEGVENIKRTNLSAKINHKLTSKWTSTLSGRFMDESKDWIESERKILNISDTADVPYNDEERNKRYEGSLSFDYLSGDKYSMKFRLFGSFYDHNWNKYAASDGSWVDTSDTEDKFYEMSYTSNYVIGEKHIATYGLDYSYQDLTSTELISTKEANKSFSAYLQYEYQINKKWNFVLGERVEDHSAYGTHFTPSLNVMYKSSDNFKVRGFVGKGFRAPSIKEQYFVFDHTSAGYIVYGGNAFDPNIFPGSIFKDLKQENSINSSISVEFSYGTIGLHRLTYFYNHLDDMIDFILIKIDPQKYFRGIYVYQNIETAITQGIEWESRIRLSQSIDFSFSYNYLKTKDLTTGEELRNRPQHTIKLFLSGHHDESGIGGSIYGDYASKKIWVPRTNTGGNENVDTSLVFVKENDYAPERFTLNLNVYKQFDNNIELFGRFENILNQVEPLYGYWPGFEMFFGIKYEF